MSRGGGKIYTGGHNIYPSGAGEPANFLAAPWSWSRLRKNQEPEPLQKKTGAGTAKNLPLLYCLLEDKKHKEIVYLLLFFR